MSIRLTRYLVPALALGLLAGCTDDGSTATESDTGLDGSGAPIDPTAFASAMESSDGRSVYVSFAEPVAAVLDPQKDTIENPIFIGCGSTQTNPLAEGRANLSGDGRVLEIKLCVTDDECLSLRRGGPGGTLCGSTDHFLVQVPSGTFATADDGEQIPALEIVVDEVPVDERPVAALSADASVEVCAPITVDARGSVWPAGRTGTASIKVGATGSDGQPGWDCAPNGCSAGDSMTLIPSRVTAAWPFVVTAVDSAGRVDVASQDVEVTAGPEPTLTLDVVRDAASDDLLVVVTHEGGGCGDAPPTISLSATAGGEPVAIDWHPRLPGTVGVIAGIVVAGLRDTGATELVVTATLDETNGGGRSVTSSTPFGLDDAAPDTALVIEGAQRTFVYGKEGYRIHRTRRLEPTVHHVDDWQGETAYLRVTLVSPDGSQTFAYDYPALPDVTEIPHPSVLLGEAASPGTWVMTVAAYVGDEQVIAPTMIDVELAQATLTGTIEARLGDGSYGDTVVARAPILITHDEFSVWYDRPTFSAASFAVTYPDGTRQEQPGSEEGVFEIPRGDSDFTVVVSWASNAAGVIDDIAPVELQVPARDTPPVVAHINAPESLPYHGEFSFVVDVSSLSDGGLSFRSGTWTYTSPDGVISGDLDSSGRGRVDACTLPSGGTLTINGTAQVGTRTSDFTVSGSLMLRPPIALTGTLSVPARIARSEAGAIELQSSFDDERLEPLLGLIGGSSITVTGGSVVFQDDAHFRTSTVDLSRAEPGRYTATLTAPAASCGIEGSVSASFDINAPPRGGSCVVTPLTGDELVAGTGVSVAAIGYTDPEDDYPLAYLVTATGIDPVSGRPFVDYWNAADATPQEESDGLIRPGTNTITCVVRDALGDSVEVGVPVTVTTPPITDFAGWDITPPELATGLVEIFGTDPDVTHTVRSFRTIDSTDQIVWEGPSTANEVVGVIVRPLSPTGRSTINLVSDSRVTGTPFTGYGTVIAAFAPSRAYGVAVTSTDGRPFDAIVDVVVRNSTAPRTIATWDAWGVPVLLLDNSLGNTQAFALNVRRQGPIAGKLELFTCPGAAWEGVAVCGAVGGVQATATRTTGTVPRGATLWAFASNAPDAPAPVGLGLVAEFAGDMGISYQSP